MRKIAFAVISLLCAALVVADTVADWRRDQAAIEALLQQKRFADARKASIKLTNRMLDRLGAKDGRQAGAREIHSHDQFPLTGC